MSGGIDVHWPDNAGEGITQPTPPPPPPALGVEGQSFVNPETQSFSNPEAENSIQPNVYSGPVEITAEEPNVIDVLDENEAENFLGKYFYKSSSSKVFLTGFLLFSLIPFLLSFLGALTGGVLFSSGMVNFFRDIAGLSYFTLGIFLPVLLKKMMDSMPKTIESLSSVVELNTEKQSSSMTAHRLDELINFYSLIYCKATGRNLEGLREIKDIDLIKFKRLLYLMRNIIVILCILYSIGTVWGRFTANDPVMEWHHFQASAIAWVGRSISDVILTAVMGPLVLWPIVLCVMLTFHSLKEVADSRSLKYVRFSKDEAGGLGEYGMQSFLNTIALLPYAGIIIGILAQGRLAGTTISFGFICASITYMGLLLFVFFFPLSRAAKSMGILKRDELNFISMHYASAYEDFKAELAKEEKDLDELRGSSEAMILADQVFQGILSQPSVPYSRALIARLVATMTPVFGIVSGFIAF